MNKLIACFFILLSITAFYNCEEDSHDNVVDKNDHNDTVYEGTVDDLYLDLDTVYMYLRTKQITGTNSPYIYAMSMSDIAEHGGGIMDNLAFISTIASFNADYTDINLEGLWLKYFYGIQHCNRILFNTSLESNPDKDQLIAEVNFLKAYMQFEMLKFFGNIPDFDNYIPLTDSSRFTQLSAAKTFESIISNLDLAANGLPQKSNILPENYFRPTKGAAYALMGKAYLYMASPYYNLGSNYYINAKESFENVINSGEYAMVIDYGSQFLKTGEFGAESVFEIDFNNVNAWDWNNILINEGNEDPRYVTVRGTFDIYDGVGGWSFLPVKTSLVDLFDAEGDNIRKDATIIDCEYLSNQGADVNSAECYQYTGYTNNKVTLRVDESLELYNSETNDRIIRFSDVLLMYAEACLNVGDVAKATDYVNMVRSRAGLLMYTSVTLDNIMKERLMELAFEGHRFFDLVRNNYAQSVLGSKGFISGKSEILPIPEAVLTGYPNFNQNPNY